MAAAIPGSLCPLQRAGSVPSPSSSAVNYFGIGRLPASSVSVFPSSRPWRKLRRGARLPKDLRVDVCDGGLLRLSIEYDSYLSALQKYRRLVGTSRSFLALSRVYVAPSLSGRCVSQGFSKTCRRNGKFRSSSIICLASRGGKVGRVGTHDGEGNVSVASFGIKPRRKVGLKRRDFAKTLSALLPYIVVATALAALVQPCTFGWVSKEYYAPALGGIMLSIGIQLSLKDFALALNRPKPVLAGYVAQYGIKPLLGLLVAKVCRVPLSFISGFLLMASVAGAQLSSYASYLSEGDVALSIVLTSLSTITSVLVTPVLTGLLIGSVVPVDAVAMAKSILQVVLCPVILGLLLNTYAKSVVDVVRPVMPLVAMFCTSMCIGGPLALNRAQIASFQGALLLVPVVIFHSTAFACGYWMSKLPGLRFDEKAAKTISLCTGMQSSTLAGLLACQFLGGSQAVPAACSVVVMAVMGLSLASFWGSGRSFRDVARSWRFRRSRPPMIDFSLFAVNGVELK